MSDENGDLISPPEWPAEQRAWLEKNIDAEALRMFAFEQVRDAQVAYDCVEDSLSAMAGKPIAELEEIGNPQGYAYLAVARRVSNWRRDRRKFATWPVGFDAPDTAPSPEIQVGSVQECAELLRMLPEDHLAPFLLCKYYGYTSKQAAEKLNIGESLVKKRVARALMFLNPDGRAARRRSLKSRIRIFFKRRKRNHDK
jgi:DNA-directed RNA polymerase specialized sigma24 family protein